MDKKSGVTVKTLEDMTSREIQSALLEFNSMSLAYEYADTLVAHYEMMKYHKISYQVKPFTKIPGSWYYRVCFADTTLRRRDPKILEFIGIAYDHQIIKAPSLNSFLIKPSIVKEDHEDDGKSD